MSAIVNRANGAAAPVGSAQATDGVDEPEKKTAEVVLEVIKAHGNAILSGTTGVVGGYVIGGPIGAVVVGSIGVMSGAEEDRRCSVM